MRAPFNTQYVCVSAGGYVCVSAGGGSNTLVQGGFLIHSLYISRPQEWYRECMRACVCVCVCVCVALPSRIVEWVNEALPLYHQ